MTNFDHILPRIGEFGRYQKLRFFLVCCIGFWIGLSFGVIMFIIMPQDHWCAIQSSKENLPEQYWNKSQQDLEELLIPKKEDYQGNLKKEKCQMWDPFNCKHGFLYPIL